MDKLPEINVEATKEKEVFRQYRTYQFTLPEELLQTITPKYTLEMPAFTGLVNSKTENAAIRNVDFQRRVEKFFDQFNRALYKLSKKEREIITKAYWDRNTKVQLRNSKRATLMRANILQNQIESPLSLGMQ